MKIELSRIESSTSIINVRFHLESTDHKSYKTAGGKVVKLSKQNFFHRLPLGVKDIHPDIVALSILLVVYPFVGKRLHFPFKISKLFRDTVYANLNGMYVGPEDESITPRKEPTIESGARPAMCFSNGVDSTAGLLMMPKNTAVIFHDHYMYPHRGYNYNKDNVYHGLNEVKMRLPNDFFIVESDMEYVRISNGFTIDIGVASGAILLSDYLNLDSIGYGYCMHDINQVNSSKIPYVCTGDHNNFRYDAWNNIYKSCGLYINLVTMGLTEIGTYLVSSKSILQGLQSACMRGRLHHPCMACMKCFRKTLLRLRERKHSVPSARRPCASGRVSSTCTASAGIGESGRLSYTY